MPLSRIARPSSKPGASLRRGALLAALLSVSPMLSAHDTLPAQWCADPNTVPVVVAQFDFPPEMLQAYREANPILNGLEEGGVCNDLKSCGIVDDWFWADQLSHEYCAGIGVQKQRTATAQTSPAPTSPAALPMPIVNTPDAFNARDHHSLYSFRKGHLVGACVVCVTPATPAPSPPKQQDLPSR